MNNAEKKSVVSEVGGWLWGTIEGGFNEQQSISQIIVDAAIGMIPLVGDATAVRDLIAVILRLVEHPERRKEKLQWMILALLLFALIPVAGGVIKGVGRLILEAGEDVAKHGELFAQIVECVNRIGEGNAVKFLRELDFEKYTGDILYQCQKLTQTLDNVIGSVLRRAHLLIPDTMIERLERIQAGLRELRELADKMIPDALKDLNGRLKAIQRHIYDGTWHDIPSSLNSATREAEARLVERADEATKLKPSEIPHEPFPGNAVEEFKPRPGWPVLNRMERASEVISSFSGPIEAVELKEGDEIFRVVEKTKISTDGLFWILKKDFPTDGATWRTKWAVLNRFNRNGRYVRFVVPKGVVIRAWKGTVASQTARYAHETQRLPGGAIQLVIDFRFEANRAAGKLVRNLKRELTNWTHYMNLNFTPTGAKVERLGETEIAPKVAARALRAGNDDNQQAQPRGTP